MLHVTSSHVEILVINTAAPIFFLLYLRVLDIFKGSWYGANGSSDSKRQLSLIDTSKVVIPRVQVYRLAYGTVRLAIGTDAIVIDRGKAVVP